MLSVAAVVRHLPSTSVYHFSITGQTVEMVGSFKYFGIILGNRLNIDHQSTDIHKSCQRRFPAIHKFRAVSVEPHLLLLIESILLYCTTCHFTTLTSLSSKISVTPTPNLPAFIATATSLSADHSIHRGCFGRNSMNSGVKALSLGKFEYTCAVMFDLVLDILCVQTKKAQKALTDNDNNAWPFSQSKVDVNII